MRLASQKIADTIAGSTLFCDYRHRSCKLPSARIRRSHSALRGTVHRCDVISIGSFLAWIHTCHRHCNRNSIEHIAEIGSLRAERLHDPISQTYLLRKNQKPVVIQRSRSALRDTVHLITMGSSLERIAAFWHHVDIFLGFHSEETIHLTRREGRKAND